MFVLTTILQFHKCQSLVTIVLIQVVTIESIPFIYTYPALDSDGSCAEVDNRIPCVRPNSTGGKDH